MVHQSAGLFSIQSNKASVKNHKDEEISALIQRKFLIVSVVVIGCDDIFKDIIKLCLDAGGVGRVGV